MGNFIQFELWKDCSNHCNFCFNLKQQDVNKIDSLNFVLEKLRSDEIDYYDEIGFIGGEFFDKEIDDLTVRQLFYELFDELKHLKDKNQLKKIYLTTALLFDMEKHLIPFLTHLKEIELLDIVLLCTSHELKYRFKTEEKKLLWENNMKTLHMLYPELLLHTEIIITQFFINAVINNEFDINTFKLDYNTSIDFIEPSSGFFYHDKKDMAKVITDWFPTKDSFIEFLDYTVSNNLININTFISMELRSNDIYFVINGVRTFFTNRRDKEYKMITTPSAKYEIGFIDSDERMIDIVNEYKELMGEY